MREINGQPRREIMLKKICLICCATVLVLTSAATCNGDEPNADPTATPAPSTPETHDLVCHLQALIDLLEDIPPNGLVINLPVCTFTFDTINNTPDDPDAENFGGVALPVIDGPVTINGTNGTIFTRSTADGTEPFRFFFIEPTGWLTVNGITFTNGNVNMEMIDLDRKGGAILNYYGGLTVDNCTFEDNQAQQGGAIANEIGGLYITNSWFLGNHSYREGGAVAIFREIMQYSEISGCGFTENTAESHGGALYSEGRLRLMLFSTFERNQSLGSGGAMAIVDGVIMATDVDFDQNTADMGGAVAVYDTDEQVFFQQCTFTNNMVTAPLDSRGGGVYLRDVSEAEFDSCQVNDNSADNGGGLYVKNSNVEMGNSSSVIGNQAGIMGGGVYLDHDSTAVINATDLTDNTAGHYGGAIHSYGDLTLNEVNILSNEALEFLGGGISNHFGNVSIINSAVADNTALLGGGGLESDSYGSIFNSTFSGNEGDNCSAIFFEDQLDIVSSTIAFNTAGSGAALFTTHGTANVKNTIIAENTISGLGTYNCMAAVTAFGDNLDDDGSCDGFNLTGNPRLEALDYNGGSTKNHAITFFSDAFNAVQDCSDLSGTDVDTDQRGVMRPQDEDCDIGAFELEVMTGHPFPPYPYLIFQNSADCRLEPSSNSAALTSFQPDDIVEVVGRNINLTWYQVAPAELEDPCWVWVGQVEFVGDLDDVEIIPAKGTVEDKDETSEVCPPPAGGCPLKESPQCWDETQCKCIPCD